MKNLRAESGESDCQHVIEHVNAGSTNPRYTRYTRHSRKCSKTDEDGQDYVTAVIEREDTMSTSEQLSS